MVGVKLKAWVVGRGMYGIRGFERHKVGVTIFPVDSQGNEMNDWYILGSKDVVIMQSVGMQDMRGVDIYEGDIVSMWYAPKATAKGVIEFKCGAFRFNTDEAKPSSSIAYDCIHKYGNSFTVIGNIHENPELVKIR